MSRREWLGQVMFEGGRWESSGRFDHLPTNQDLREKAWNVIGMKPRGAPPPTHVRAVTVTYQAMPAIPFREGPP